MTIILCTVILTLSMTIKLCICNSEHIVIKKWLFTKSSTKAGTEKHFSTDNCRFCSNAYTTSTYTPASFLPLNLFHQLSHPANFYFLMIVFLQLIPELSPTSWITTFVPLSCILLLNGIKDVHYDYNRHQSDKRVGIVLSAPRPLAGQSPSRIIEVHLEHKRKLKRQ